MNLTVESDWSITEIPEKKTIENLHKVVCDVARPSTWLGEFPSSGTDIANSTSFLGSLSSASPCRWEKDPGHVTTCETKFSTRVE